MHPGKGALPRPLTCPACGNPVSEKTRYCPDCGAYQDPYTDRIKRSRRTKRRWESVKGIILFYVIFLCSMLPLHWIPDEHQVVGETVVYIMDACIVLVYWLVTRTSLRENFRLTDAAVKYSMVGMLILVPFLALNLVYHHLLFRLFELPWRSYLESYQQGGYGLWMGVLFVCVMPAIWEEIAFRGLIQGRLKSLLSPKEALMITAAMFAIIHVSVLSWVILFALGLLLGWLRERSGSLIPGMIAHFIHNLVIILIEYYP